MKPQGHKAKVSQLAPDLLRLTNGLVTRDFLLQVPDGHHIGSSCESFRLQPAFATWDLHSAEADSSILRAFSPEARLVVKASGEEVEPSNTSINYDSPTATAKGVLCHQIGLI